MGSGQRIIFIFNKISAARKGQVIICKPKSQITQAGGPGFNDVNYQADRLR